MLAEYVQNVRVQEDGIAPIADRHANNLVLLILLSAGAYRKALKHCLQHTKTSQQFQMLRGFFVTIKQIQTKVLFDF